MNLDARIQPLLAAVVVSAIGASLVMLALPGKVTIDAVATEEGVSSANAAIIPVRAVRVIVASPYHR